MATANPTKVVTEPVRLSFPHVFEAYSFEDEPAKFSVMLLIPKDDKKTLTKIRKAEKAAIERGISSTWNGKKPREILSILKDADEDGTAEDFPEREGHYYMTVRSKNKPQVVDASVQPILDASEVYSGCYGRVSISAFPYKFGGNSGVSFGLNNLQKTADGESLGGGSRAEDDFDEFEDDDELI